MKVEDITDDIIENILSALSKYFDIGEISIAKTDQTNGAWICKKITASIESDKLSKLEVEYVEYSGVPDMNPLLMGEDVFGASFKVYLYGENLITTFMCGDKTYQREGKDNTDKLLIFDCKETTTTAIFTELARDAVEKFALAIRNGGLIRRIPTMPFNEDVAKQPL